MKTTLVTDKRDADRRWVLIDAADRPLGRVATEVAVRLRGKHRPDFTPQTDTGDFVVVVNASKVVLTGRKAETKFWTRHSGKPGGLRRTPYGVLRRENPARLVELAVRRMLPKNRLGRRLFRKLRVYPGEAHPHAAQKPERVAS